MRFHYLLAWAWLLSLPRANAQQLARLPLPNRIGLLNDRAQLNFPAAAKANARPADIMAADPNANRETRVVLDQGDNRLVFFAQDLHMRGDRALITSVLAKRNTASGAKTTTIADDGRLLAVLSTPTAFDSSQTAILVNTVTVRTADNLVFQVRAFINPAAYRRRAEYAALTERVFQTLTAGSRLVPHAARTETLAIFNSSRKFNFSLPENYGITVDQKYDFQVFLIQPYVLFGADAASTLLVYVGKHPSMLYKQFKLSREQLQPVPGSFLGRPVEWLTHADAAKQQYLQEQVIDGKAVEEGLMLHVGMVADSPAALTELVSIAATVALLP